MAVVVLQAAIVIIVNPRFGTICSKQAKVNRNVVTYMNMATCNSLKNIYNYHNISNTTATDTLIDACIYMYVLTRLPLDEVASCSCQQVIVWQLKHVHDTFTRKTFRKRGILHQILIKHLQFAAKHPNLIVNKSDFRRRCRIAFKAHRGAFMKLKQSHAT